MIAGILFFPLILRFEFKSPEELKLQPKTHEEHLATQNESDNDEDDDEDDEDNESLDEQSDVASSELNRICSSEGRRRRKSSTIPNETSIEFLENKDHEGESIELNTLNVYKTSNNDLLQRSSSTLSNLKTNLLGPLDEVNEIQLEPMRKFEKINNSIENLPTMRNFNATTIPWTQRFYEFFNAPITKFWYNAIFYLIFLFLFTYTVLVRTPQRPNVSGKN